MIEIAKGKAASRRTDRGKYPKRKAQGGPTVDMSLPSKIAANRRSDWAQQTLRHALKQRLLAGDKSGAGAKTRGTGGVSRADERKAGDPGREGGEGEGQQRGQGEREEEQGLDTDESMEDRERWTSDGADDTDEGDESASDSDDSWSAQGPRERRDDYDDEPPAPAPLSFTTFQPLPVLA